MISLLPQDLINKIAAGEVVERPASVVKELVENALDADATHIEVALEEGGIKRIQITDNGKGMNEEDAKLCLLRHATSKLTSSDDLFNIHTMGFRGEALASIASVSQFELITKTADANQAYQVTLDENLQPHLAPAPGNTGTRVIVNHLFYSVPARQKFLKKPQTEFSHIAKYLQQFALANADRDLKLIHNGKIVFHYPSQKDSERVKAVLGAEFQSKLITVSTAQPDIQMHGWVAKPELVHATHKNQYLFVNGRPVYDHLVNRSVLQAYQTMVPKGYFPAFVLHLDINPALVDVNVHPRKSEVKFQNPSAIIQLITSTIAQELNQQDITSDRQLNEFISMPSVSPVRQGSSPSFSVPRNEKPSPAQVKQALNFSSSFSSSIREIKSTPLEEQHWRIIGQIHRSFILVETPEGLQLLDQHAISEITNYDRLMKEKNNGEICSQKLLLPEQLELSAEEKSILEENKSLLERMGWEIDFLQEQVIQVGALPEILKVENLSDNLHDLLSKLKEEEETDMSSRELALLKYEACRGAVMFGDALTIHEMEGLLNQWLQVPNNAACEHGRPAAARISVEEMRRYFKR